MDIIQLWQFLKIIQINLFNNNTSDGQMEENEEHYSDEFDK